MCIRDRCANDMKNLKSQLEWLKEVDSTALQSALRDLDSAYQKFFKEHSGYPKFKSLSLIHIYRQRIDN